MTRYPVTGPTRPDRERAAYNLRNRAMIAVGYSTIDWKVDPPELVFPVTLTADQLALLGSLPTAASTATMPMAGVVTTTVVGGPHEHVDLADADHTHPAQAHAHPEFVHTHQVPDHPDLAGHTGLGLAEAGHTHPGGAHPDLAAHTSLGLAPAHAHDFAATGHSHSGVYEPVHSHPYASTGHNHDASYAPTHSHPYAATSHAHVIGDTTGLQAALDGKSATGHTHAGGSSPWTLVIATADESKNNLAVVANDATLTATLTANTQYAIRLSAFFLTNATADLKYRLVFSGTTTRVRRKVQRTATTDIAVTTELKTAFDSADVILSTTGLNPWLEEDVVLQVGASGGTLALQWAQVTSGPGPTTRLEGSYLEYATS